MYVELSTTSDLIAFTDDFEAAGGNLVVVSGDHGLDAGACERMQHEVSGVVRSGAITEGSTVEAAHSPGTGFFSAAITSGVLGMLSPETRPSVAEVGDGWVLGRAAADELGVEPGMIMTVDDHRAEVSAVVDTEGRNPQMSRRIMFLTAPHGRSAQCLIEYESGVARGRTEAASVVIRRFRSPSIRMGIWSTVSTKRQPNASTTPSSSPASNHSSLAHRTWASTARPIDPDVKLGAYATTSARIPKATCIPRDSHIRTDTYRSRLNGTNAQPGTRSPSTRRPMHRSRTRKRVRRERHDMRPATRIRGVEQHTSHNARHSNGGTHEQQSAIKTPSQLDAASKTPNIRHCVHRRSLWLSLLPAAAMAGTTAYKCANAGCKYGQVRAAYTTLKHDRVDDKGATASGTCDPTNDVTRWRVERLRVYENGAQVYTTNSPFGWHTNCALQTYAWNHDVIRDAFPSSMYTKTHWEWDASCGGCDFDEWINSYSY